MNTRLSFLPGPAAAAMASVLLAVVFALYIVPYGVIVCTFGVPADVPDVRTGEAWFEKPATTVVSLRKDGTIEIGATPVRDVTQLRALLRQARAAAPSVPLEIRADHRVATTAVMQLIAAGRDAGYDEAYVFGQPHALVELAAK